MNCKLSSCLLSLIFIVSASFSSITPAKEILYKWVDKNGVTHYGDKTPKNEQVEELSIRINRPDNTVPGKAPEEKMTPISVAEPMAPSNKNPGKCRQVNQRLDKIKSNARIRIHDTSTGKWRYLSAEEKDQQIEDLNQQRSIFCNGR